MTGGSMTSVQPPPTDEVTEGADVGQKSLDHLKTLLREKEVEMDRLKDRLFNLLEQVPRPYAPIQPPIQPSLP